MKEQFDKEIEFLFDHWIMEDKPPYTFGGWREEVLCNMESLANAHAMRVLDEFVNNEMTRGTYSEDDEIHDMRFILEKDLEQFKAKLQEGL